ncbi:MAG: hypothetical protein Fur0024_4420 [Patescibacteria group bacterium]
MFEELKKIAQKSPHKPGVYIWKKNEEILYVGKAKDLKNRLTSYFQKNISIKTSKLIEKTNNITWTIVDNEFEALILENNLIKEHKPPYNVIFRDDKDYIFIKIGTSEEVPKIEAVRRRGAIFNKKDTMIGPFTNSEKVRKMIDFAIQIFSLSACNREYFVEENGFLAVKGKKGHCIACEIKRSISPCNSQITKDDYLSRIKLAEKFLKGNFADAKIKLQEKMQKLAMEKKFEAAASVRDTFFALNEISNRQKVFYSEPVDWDFIGIANEKSDAIITLFKIRLGKMIEQNFYELKLPENSNLSEGMERFLIEYYTETSDFPKEIFISENIENLDILKEAILKSQSENVQNFEIKFPQIGDKKKLVDLATKNSIEELRKRKPNWKNAKESNENQLKKFIEILKQKIEITKFKIQDAENLKNFRIECYDVSHFSGSMPISSMVVNIGGEMKKSHFRKFNLVSTGTNDDYAGMIETISRRFKNYFLAKEKNEKFFLPKKLEIEKIRENIKEIEKTILEDLKIKNQKLKVLEKLSGKNLEPINQKKEEKNKNLDEEKLKEQIFRTEKIGEFSEIFIQVLKNEILKNEKIIKEKTKELKKLEPDESFLQLPNILLIDGGKGQISVVKQITKNLFGENLPFLILGIAKGENRREDHIFEASSNLDLEIDKNSEESFFLQKIRDEAHRFAKKGNAKRLENEIKKSKIDDINGIGTKTKKKLIEKFGSIKDAMLASKEDLVKVIGEKLAGKLKG